MWIANVYFTDKEVYAMRKIRVGSRESKLAVIQSEIVIDMIKKNNPDVEVELITMKTTGDKILNTTLDKVGGKGLFVKELDRALLAGEIDIAVHSLKDVPMEIDDRIPLVAFTKCESPCDVLVLPKGVNEIDWSKPIGCSSMRRSIQFKKMYPDAVISPVRGNVLTRLDKLDRGDYSALILANAGLNRLGLSDRISRIFSEDEMIPAAGQGVIAIQGRAGDNYDYLEKIDNKESKLKVEAERAFVKTLDGGCSSPVAAHAVLEGDIIKIKCLYVDEENMSVENMIIDTIEGDVSEHISLGVKLAERVKKQGKAGE